MTREIDPIERTLREKLGADVTPDPERRARLVERILTDAPVPAARPRRIFRWAWFGGGAAAVVLLAVALWPEPTPTREPIPPTALFADLFGPLAESVPAEETAPAPETPDEPTAAGALAGLWQDVAAPASFGRLMLTAPGVVAAPDRERKPSDTRR